MMVKSLFLSNILLNQPFFQIIHCRADQKIDYVNYSLGTEYKSVHYPTEKDAIVPKNFLSFSFYYNLYTDNNIKNTPHIPFFINIPFGKINQKREKAEIPAVSVSIEVPL